jgi:hypothetical protein
MRVKPAHDVEYVADLLFALQMSAMTQRGLITNFKADHLLVQWQIAR